MSQIIKHLYGRAGFGLSAAEYAEKRDWTREQGVADLLNQARHNRPLHIQQPAIPEDLRTLSQAQKRDLIKASREGVQRLNIEWIKRMADPAQSALLERMTLFWHGHFACRTTGSRLAENQLNTLRQHALGNFRDLVLAIARDPSMIRYLNNQQNRKQQPNENFARELMELFTLGRGHYTEQDIKEAARAFTGWSSNLKGEFVFRRYWHDTGRKTFMGKSGNFGGEDIIDIILEKPEAARFIAGKIFDYFVSDRIDEVRVQELADRFYNSGYDIADLMHYLLTSDWFYEEKYRGAKIKSPVDLMAGLMRTLHLQFGEERAILYVERTLGQMLFNPPNVAGWPGGRNWIDNSTLMVRANLGNFLLLAAEANIRPKDNLKAQVRGAVMRRIEASVDLSELARQTEGMTDTVTLDYLFDWLLVTEPANGRALVSRFSGGATREDQLKEAMARILSLPEYQMC